jgi:cyanophycin synthetase
VGVCGTDGKSLAAHVVATLLHLRGDYVGLACADGLYFAQRLIDRRNSANWAAAQKVLLNRSVGAAVIENSSDTILGEGLGYDRCQVGIITNIDAARHFGKFHIETAEQVCNVLRTQVDVVLESGVAVLNADDPLVAPMAEHCDGEVVYFSQHADSKLITAHLQQGGRAVLLRDGVIELHVGDEQAELIKLVQVPVLADGDTVRVLSVLAAVAAAWALGVTQSLIRAGLETFEVPPAISKEIA